MKTKFQLNLIQKLGKEKQWFVFLATLVKYADELERIHFIFNINILSCFYDSNTSISFVTAGQGCDHSSQIYKVRMLCRSYVAQQSHSTLRVVNETANIYCNCAQLNKYTFTYLFPSSFTIWCSFCRGWYP